MCRQQCAWPSTSQPGQTGTETITGSNVAVVRLMLQMSFRSCNGHTTLCAPTVWLCHLCTPFMCESCRWHAGNHLRRWWKSMELSLCLISLQLTILSSLALSSVPPLQNVSSGCFHPAYHLQTLGQLLSEWFAHSKFMFQAKPCAPCRILMYI